MQNPRASCRRRSGGFLVLEAIVATGLLAAAAVFSLAFLQRMDQNLARTRCEAHLGMILNQNVELMRYCPYDALADAAANPTSAGYIRFGGGAAGAGEVPYRVDVQCAVPPTANPRLETALITVSVYWSPPDPATDNNLTPRPGSERLFRSASLVRPRY